MLVPVIRFCAVNEDDAGRGGGGDVCLKIETKRLLFHIAQSVHIPQLCG